MSGTKTGLLWFTCDLRVQDNPLLAKASLEVDALLCVYVVPSFSRYLKHYSQESQFSQARIQFLQQSLADVSNSLAKFGQRLFVIEGTPFQVLKELISRQNITHLYCDAFAGYDEQSTVECLTKRYSELHVIQMNTRMLFNEEQLPFDIHQLPATFTQFRKKVEELKLEHQFALVNQLPPTPSIARIHAPFHGATSSGSNVFVGGEHSGNAHCKDYFSHRFASHYKQTRNALDDLSATTRFSPWLALGSVSPQRILSLLKNYENQHGANDSTYWIYFELLWREYFYWYARKVGYKLFQLRGVNHSPPLTSFYAQHFKQWIHGTTAYPIVNACMKQLRQTGYISNRGRQLVASCLVNELSTDWRYGAAYFESQLIDYDTASNWGNWQYIAGVGPDPRGGRQFDLAKQTQLYDPDLTFITKWQGNGGALNEGHHNLSRSSECVTRSPKSINSNDTQGGQS
jgi:deoxyribodipyrimidine photo-lyase